MTPIPQITNPLIYIDQYADISLKSELTGRSSRLEAGRPRHKFKARVRFEGPVRCCWVET